jgi:hypothetical protein
MPLCSEEIANFLSLASLLSSYHYNIRAHLWRPPYSDKMKRVRHSDGPTQRTPEWFCFVRVDVRPSVSAGSLGGLFFFDVTSTKDADVILAFCRKCIREDHVGINFLFYLATVGETFRDLNNPKWDIDENPLMGSGYETMHDFWPEGGDEEPLYIFATDDGRYASLKDIESLGEWLVFPDDSDETVDMPCSQTIRFFTHVDE